VVHSYDGRVDEGPALDREGRLRTRRGEVWNNHGSLTTLQLDPWLLDLRSKLSRGAALKGLGFGGKKIEDEESSAVPFGHSIECNRIGRARTLHVRVRERRCFAPKASDDRRPRLGVAKSEDRGKREKTNGREEQEISRQAVCT